MHKFREAYQDFEKRNLIDKQRTIVKERITRNKLYVLLIVALLFTVIYGTIENPFENTFSNIGNYYDYRIVFIFWAILCGAAIQTTILTLFRLQEYHPKRQVYLIYLANFFLVATAIIPAILPTYPILHAIHTVFAGLHAVCILLSLRPYLKIVIQKNPRIKHHVDIWQIAIWGGSIVMMLLTFSGIFQLWFFISLLMFLLYLTTILFEKSIVIKTLEFFLPEENPKDTIEKVYYNYERAFKTK